MRRWATAIGVAAAALAAAVPAAASTPTIPKAELRAIRVLLRSFVPEAVGRDHPGKAWDLATPAMRSTTTRAEWRQGTLPVFPYPVAKTAYGLRPITVSPNDVTFDLMLQPAPGSDAGVEVYTTEVQRIGGDVLGRQNDLQTSTIVGQVRATAARLRPGRRGSTQRRDAH